MPKRRFPAVALSPPKWIEPQLTKLVTEAPTGDGWLHEIKYDGYRLHARFDRGRVRLLTRNGHDWSHRYRATVKAVENLPATTAWRALSQRPSLLFILRSHESNRKGGARFHSDVFILGDTDCPLPGLADPGYSGFSDRR